MVDSGLSMENTYLLANLIVAHSMPWSPTQAFPHPLASIQASSADISITNYVSYALVEMMTWQGLGDIINHFRERKLGLEPISLFWAPSMVARMRLPWTYCWSLSQVDLVDPKRATNCVLGLLR
jgi:hypothetical protein